MVDEVPKELIPVESIEFDHVWFSYENNDVYALQDFTLHIKAGDFTGIVGPSGSGKSTLLSLLMGIYKPTKGPSTLMVLIFQNMILLYFVI